MLVSIDIYFTVTIAVVLVGNLLILLVLVLVHAVFVSIQVPGIYVVTLVCSFKFQDS